MTNPPCRWGSTGDGSGHGGRDMTYKLKMDILVTTSVTVVLAFFGIWLERSDRSRACS